MGVSPYYSINSVWQKEAQLNMQTFIKRLEKWNKRKKSSDEMESKLSVNFGFEPCIGCRNTAFNRPHLTDETDILYSIISIKLPHVQWAVG